MRICDYCDNELIADSGSVPVTDVYGNDVCRRCAVECAGCGRALSLAGLFFLIDVVERGDGGEPSIQCPDCTLETLMKYAPPEQLDDWTEKLHAEKARRRAEINASVSG